MNSTSSSREGEKQAAPAPTVPFCDCGDMLYYEDPAVAAAAPLSKAAQKAALQAGDENIEEPAAAAASGGLMLVCKRCSYREPVRGATVVLDMRKPGSDAYNVNLINKYTKFDPTLPVERMYCPNPRCPSAAAADGSATLVDVCVIRTNYERLEYKFLCPQCDFVWDQPKA